MRAVFWSLIVCLVGAVLASASESPVNPQTPPKVEKRKKKPDMPMGAAEESAARNFAKQHHPELLPILDHLKKERQREYRRAISDLHKAAARLAQWKKKNPTRYELELDAWKLRSRIQLLAAQVRLEPDDAKLLTAIRRALLEQADMQIAACEAERDRQAERLKQLEAHLRQLREGRLDRVNKQIEAWTRSKKHTAPKSVDRRPASKKSGGGRNPAESGKQEPRKPHPKTATPPPKKAAQQPKP